MYRIFKAVYKPKESAGYSMFAVELTDDMVCIHHISGKIPYCSDILNAMYQMSFHEKYKPRINPYSVAVSRGLTGHRYMQLRSYIGVYKVDPSEMEITKTDIYGSVSKGAGLYEVKSRIEFNSSGKIDPSCIGVNISYWISDILEFLLSAVNIFGSTEAEIDEVDTVHQYQPIIYNVLNSDLIEQKIRDLLFEDEDESEDEEDEDESEE